MRFIQGKSTDEIVSHLAEGAELVGELSFTNGVRIEGVVKGKVHAEAILEIGPAGKIEAEATVRNISIRGEFRGIIHASDRVEIHKEGKVYGEIFSPCLIIEAGAVFEGSCNMSERLKNLDEEKAGSLPLNQDQTHQTNIK
jgi:cytoskeletal protein CcmA (bactofilin family)